MMLILTSEVLGGEQGRPHYRYDKPRMYDVAATILQQRLSQVRGVGQVTVGGGAPPAVRVDVNPTVLHHFGLGLEDIRTTLNDANANRPKGQIADESRAWSISTTDQLMTAKEYEPLIVTYRKGRAGPFARRGDRHRFRRRYPRHRHHGRQTFDHADRLPATRSANIIETVDRIRNLVPMLQAQVPAGMILDVGMDRTSHDPGVGRGRPIIADHLDGVGHSGRIYVSCGTCGRRLFPASPCPFR